MEVKGNKTTITARATNIISIYEILCPSCKANWIRVGKGQKTPVLCRKCNTVIKVKGSW